MPESWVVNASPLIVLAKIDHLDLLTQLAQEVVIPIAVVDEILAGNPADPARRFVEGKGLPIVEAPPQQSILSWDLGAGKTALLSYANQNPGCRAVVDDGMARRCARSLSIPLLGTLGIIIRARQKLLIPAAGPLLTEMINQDFRINDEVVRRALRETVGEELD